MGPTNGILYSYDMARVWEPTSQLGVGAMKINVRTIENADILVTRFDNETANGVLWVIKHKGMTGYGAQKLSTSTNKKPHTELAAKRPQIRGCDQDISSVDLRLNPRRRHPTVPTSVREPRKSIRRSLSEVLSCCNSYGSLTLTLSATKMKEKVRTGVFITALILAIFISSPMLTWSKNADRLEK